MTILYISISIARILVRLNNIDTKTSVNTARILVRLNNMNTNTNMSIACIPD